jgi:hypothetical protein
MVGVQLRNLCLQVHAGALLMLQVLHHLVHAAHHCPHEILQSNLASTVRMHAELPGVNGAHACRLSTRPCSVAAPQCRQHTQHSASMHAAARGRAGRSMLHACAATTQGGHSSYAPRRCKACY